MARLDAIHHPPSPGPGPNVRPCLMRTAILLAIYLNPSDSAVKPGQAQLVLRWVTTWEPWVLYVFLFALCRHLTRCTHTPSPPFRFLPSLPTCTHGTCATAYGHGPGGPLPHQPAARAVLSSLPDMGDYYRLGRICPFLTRQILPSR